jgi:dTDP-4-dehydrorhamnose 3,5-epimerase
MRLRPTPIDGCFVTDLPRFPDERGEFTKVIHHTTMASLGLPTDFVEQYYTRSRRGVIRGLHFQVPPHQHFKLVHCLAGAMLDVVVDVRRGSPTYGEHVAIPLAGDRPEAVCVPVGCAHGFAALSDDTLAGYWVTSEHAPEADGGVRWDSAGVAWPAELGEPVVSARDAGLPPLDSFNTPFSWTAP